MMDPEKGCGPSLLLVALMLLGGPAGVSGAPPGQVGRRGGTVRAAPAGPAKAPGPAPRTGVVLSEKDLANLEALTLEFADEISVLSRKVTDLEENQARVGAELDEVEARVGPRDRDRRVSAGLHGLASLRLVHTGEGGPEGAVGSTFGPAGVSLASYAPLTRYSGDVILPDGTPGGRQLFSDRTFVTIPQLSVSVDREFLEGAGVHVQVDLDADAADNLDGFGVATPVDLPGGGAALQINEAWVDVHDVSGGVGARIGAFALPVTREHNGSHRTLDATISPSAVSWRLESFRPLGVELRSELLDRMIEWRVAVFSGLSGSRLAPGLPVTLVNSGMLFPALSLRTMLGIPTVGHAPYSDVPFGIPSSGRLGIIGSDVGVFARLASGQPEVEDIQWDLNVLYNGGDISLTDRKRISGSEFGFAVASLAHYWEFFDLVSQAYFGRTRNTALTGQVPNPGEDPVESFGFFVLVGYRFDPFNDFSLRYEYNKDEVEALGRLEVQTVTLAYNHQFDGRSALQVEALFPAARSEALTAPAAPGTGPAPSSAVDPDDTLVQINYKFTW